MAKDEDENGWQEYKLFVKASLDDLNKETTNLRIWLQKIDVRLAIVEVKVAIWATGGAMVGALVFEIVKGFLFK